MRKFMSVILVAALLAVSAVPVFGSSPEGGAALERAIQRARAVIDIPREASIFEHSSWEDPANGGRTWSLNWRDQNFDLSYSVTINDEGTILNFFANQRREDGGLGTMSRQQGQRVAEEFLSKVAPSEIDDIRLRDFHSSEWRFTYIFGAYMNGFPVSDMMFSIDVDQVTERVSSYFGPSNFNRDMAFPVPEEKISAAEAKEAFIESGSLSIEYRSFFDFHDQQMIIFPALIINTSQFVDAESGEIVSGTNMHWASARGFGGAQDGMGVAESELTPGERDAVDNVAGMITREQAVRYATSRVPSLSASSTLTHAHLSARFDDRAIFDWHLQFEDYAATINAVTGELVSFFNFGGQQRNRPSTTVSIETAERTARQFINSVAADRFNQTVFDENRSTSRIQPLPAIENFSYTFTFIRTVNGVNFPHNFISIAVDSSSGRITHYHLNWHDGLQFPAITGGISMEEAFDIYAADSGFGLLYTRISDDNMKLVYGFMSSPIFSLDPATGAKIGHDGQPFRPLVSVLSYDDIEGRWYEETVRILLDNGFFLPGSSFNGSAEITQEEFLRYLYAPMQSFFSQDEFYNMLVQNRMITREEIAPDSILARQDAAKFAIRYLGLEKAAQDDSIFINHFNDTIAEGYLGYTALVRALGIMQGDTRGNFNGAFNMTRAQSAVVILNLLNSR